MKKSNSTRTFGALPRFWPLDRERSLNWLALGLLLAAWNAANDGSAESRPLHLHGYTYVSPCAAMRVATAS
jgi:hypothetical protein